MALAQPSLFDTQPQLPEGFRYEPEIITPDEEQALVAHFEALAFKAFEFHGFLGKRRVVSFGWRYDFNGGGLGRAEDVPDFLLPLRERAAAFAGLPPDTLEHVMVSQYPPGAGIGWHKDRPDFDKVIGVSLAAPGLFRLRRRRQGGFDRAALTVEPRSAYVIDGPARREWEHSIPPVEALRYSVTFRTLRARARARSIPARPGECREPD
ncbi:alpha-ketoglutarate-dependent dioxygenase AlkB [Phenylobacterium sp.]|jgi:alkylated DNA repair dioxygenase AlkB|uniref:alpha-ketoglutarate-dependent dioxygenase AlkB n=1 Tax=Phenylobacterium sp. TaxID=1871053 RepID=UPI002E34A74D|nr:alpha-ketoglutarate-dependent dioxygenase AlkB [Phenylobacterium sp.]HEX2558862.1 alpha-ketoglutarate-dependent dioxygenase AlkB [Phenylobacterium sp.]